MRALRMSGVIVCDSIRKQYFLCVFFLIGKSHIESDGIERRARVTEKEIERREGEREEKCLCAYLFSESFKKPFIRL